MATKEAASLTVFKPQSSSIESSIANAYQQKIAKNREAFGKQTKDLENSSDDQKSFDVKVNLFLRG